jgi:hypothetical protein
VKEIAMRIVRLAVVAVLACATLPALAQAPDSNASPLPAQVPDNSASTPPAQAPDSAPPAQPAPPTQPSDAAPPPSGRFGFNRVDGGYLRLDNQTGQIAFCTAHSVGWTCEAVPEDRAALDKEIGRLQAEVAGLKRELAGLREPPPPRPPADLSSPADKRDDAARLREDMLRQDMERARAAIENAWRRLVEMLVNFQKDMMRKG